MNIIITGASKGLGKAIAERFVSDNNSHHLFLCARHKEKLEGVANDLQSRFPQTSIDIYTCDLGRKEEVAALAEWIKKKNIPIDVLINNAGQFIPGSVHNEEDGVLEKMLQVNLMGAYNLTRAILPQMMARRKGHIFNMCSIAALQPYANGGAYSISKYALSGFTKNLREEMKPYNIKVTGIYPGAVYTDSWSGTGVDPERIMESEDIAAMIYTFAHLSPQACVEDLIVRPQLGDL